MKLVCLPLGSRCSSPYEVDCGPFDSGCFNNRTQRCDGHRDCRGSGLDEDGCPGCPKGTMPCYTHGCYHISQTCDGVPDCHDYTDEADCGKSKNDWLFVKVFCKLRNLV